MDKCKQCEELKKRVIDLEAIKALDAKVIRQQANDLITSNVTIGSMKFIIDKHESLFGVIVAATHEWRELHAEMCRGKNG